MGFRAQVSRLSAQNPRPACPLFIYLFIYVFILCLDIADAGATSHAIKQEREGGTDGTGWKGHEVSLR